MTGMDRGKTGRGQASDEDGVREAHVETTKWVRRQVQESGAGQRGDAQARRTCRSTTRLARRVGEGRGRNRLSLFMPRRQARIGNNLRRLIRLCMHCRSCGRRLTVYDVDTQAEPLLSTEQRSESSDGRPAVASIPPVSLAVDREPRWTWFCGSVTTGRRQSSGEEPQTRHSLVRRRPSPCRRQQRG